MTNNYNEGHPSAVIARVERYADSSYNEPPNVVLLMAGTEDMVRGEDLSSAPERLDHLLDEVVKSYPRAAVVVAELPPIEDADSNARSVAFNAAISGIVRPKVDEGRRISIVKMSNYMTVDDLQDGLYPTDHGYSLMAQAWYDGIKEAESKNWLAPPVTKRKRAMKRDAATTCSSSKAPSATKVKTIASGALSSAGPASTHANEIVSGGTSGAAQPTTTLTSTTTVTSTVTLKFHTQTTYTTVPKPKPTPTSTPTPCTTSTIPLVTSSAAANTTITPTSTATPNPTPTPTPTPTPSEIPPPPPNNTTIPTYPSSSPSPASIGVPSYQTSAAGGTPTPTPPPTSAASRIGGNFLWMAMGLLFFWLSGMAM